MSQSLGLRIHWLSRAQGQCAGIRSTAFRWASSSASVDPVRTKVLDRALLVSVLEASATKRDSKGYLQKYTARPQALQTVTKVSKYSSDQAALLRSSEHERRIHIAILKIGDLQSIEDRVLSALARTLSQLHILGLSSIVVVDCGPSLDRAFILEQAYRFSQMIDGLEGSRSRVFDTAFSSDEENVDSHIRRAKELSALPASHLNSMLDKGFISIFIPTAAAVNDAQAIVVESNSVVVSLTNHLSQQNSSTALSGTLQNLIDVERIIILDPVGAVPNTKSAGSCHRFVNLTQEFERILADFKQKLSVSCDEKPESDMNRLILSKHAKNLTLARDTLDMLPSSSSALITTPWAAANTADPALGSELWSKAVEEESVGDVPATAVKTRIVKNPLIHNLLTDKPVYSSSLPYGRIHLPNPEGYSGKQWNLATFVKRGIPLQIFPDPNILPWRPPTSGSSRFKLTNTCIDLGRLKHLVNDSFDRQLDLEAYLRRVNDHMAGVIVAGDYEGGAILTWEKPPGIDGGSDSLVPYLDKFAVLKTQQGSGGVADVVFNAMVRDCFPGGVCWRSRRDNPVNKWYFERSSGSLKLSRTTWTMFWTTPDLSWGHARLRDYEAVCRGVVPSWVD